MRKLFFNDEMIQDAYEKAKKLGSISNSITSGAGNTAGYLSEIALSKDIGAKNISCNTGDSKFDYDLLHNNLKIEVKTKRRTVDPRLEFDVSIAETSVHQQTDIYAFTSITFKKKTGTGKRCKYYLPQTIWLCGFISKNEFFQKARFLKKGDIDESNGFKVHANMFNLEIKNLNNHL